LKTIGSPHFTPIPLDDIYNRFMDQLSGQDCTQEIVEQRQHLLRGSQTLWGIPFELGNDGAVQHNVVHIRDDVVKLSFPQPLHSSHLVFLHAADKKPVELRADGLFVKPVKGQPQLGETVCEYILEYADGMTHKVPVRRRFQINDFFVNWGEGGFECVPHLKPNAIRTNSENAVRGNGFSSPQGFWGSEMWGVSLSRGTAPGAGSALQHWLYALENPYPEKELASLRIVPGEGTVFLFAISAGLVQSNPLRWESRKKLKLTLPDSYAYRPNNFRDFAELHLDMGQIISVLPAIKYDHFNWEGGYNNQLPTVLDREFTVEYTAHPDACFYFGPQGGERRLPVSDLARYNEFTPIGEQVIPIKLQVYDHDSGKIVPVKIHVHGEHGEYLTPVNHHRIPNQYWFEDYSVDCVHDNHWCTYINGEAEYLFPQGTIYIEVAKGFEIRPIRQQFVINPDTREIRIEIERLLPWRDKGWVSADTHVHFLSPQTAQLEGEAEGVNLINLLAAQWGELFTNIGDFDGKTTIGSKEAGGSGEYLVRVGTENRQQILGHISLIGYAGNMIMPLSSGGPGEAALGDPVSVTMTDWAMQCRAQNGIVVLPHMPEPRAEGAAVLVLEQADGVELCSLGNAAHAISPYALSDWYRYLNCGYQVPAVGGTDKMSAGTPVGLIRTYSLIRGVPFTLESWMESIRQGATFVTYGPLIEFTVEGKYAGAKIQMAGGGGTVGVQWEVATVTVPVTTVEIVVNGEIRETVKVNIAEGHHAGSFNIKITGSCWIALRVRGKYPDSDESIVAHTSSVMVIVDGKNCFDAADALTILDQIEGSMAYLRTVATRAEKQTYQRMLLTLTSAHRTLHNRMHQNGIYHHHTVVDDHHKH